jgi:hypothetical protein
MPVSSVANEEALKSRSIESQLTLVNAAALIAVLFVYRVVSQSSFSALITLAAMAQCLAFLLLVIQLRSSGSAFGMSAQGLALNAVALICRLSSTTWLNGYLPADASGDYLYQITDFASLIMISWLMYQVLHVKRDTYNAAEDNFPAASVILLSFVLGMVFHADLNASPLFDGLWMTGIFISTFAACPELFMFARTGGSDQALTINYVAAMALSRIFSGAFLLLQREDITCSEWISGINHAQLAVIGMHVLHLLLFADFFYFYFTSILRDGFNMELKLDV